MSHAVPKGTAFALDAIDYAKEDFKHGEKPQTMIFMASLYAGLAH